MMEGKSSSSRKSAILNDAYVATLFSWSLEDIYNESLYKVEKIPELFESVEQYLGSYVLPLLEETRARLHYSMEAIAIAPFAEVVAFYEKDSLLYDVKIDYWRNRFSDRGKEPYKTLPGDIVVLADAKPATASDLQRAGRTWSLALVRNISHDEDEDEDVSTATNFKVQASKDVGGSNEMLKSLFVIFLTNITTNRRIWSALHGFQNLDIVEQVLHDYSGVEEDCSHCSLRTDRKLDEKLVIDLSSRLNESQTAAVLACLGKVQCNHKSAVELIWGPPGTGKTKTISILVLTLLELGYRTLICAPTNVAIKEVASRVKLVIESYEADFCSLGDVLLYGNKDRLKVGSEIEEISLDFRVTRLTECFAPLTGWQHLFTTTINFLEDCVSQYCIFVENELIRKKEHSQDPEEKGETCSSQSDVTDEELKSFLEFARDRFHCTASPLRRCVLMLCTHVPASFLGKHNFQKISSLFRLLDSFETLLLDDGVMSEELEELFSHSESVEESFKVHSFSGVLVKLYFTRSECISALKDLRDSLRKLNLPSSASKGLIEEFCFQTASVIFCTASSSYKLHKLAMRPLNVLVIDEAAQLKECEAAIPLQLPGIKHAILIGDECQLPAMVESNVSFEAGFARSLFERLSLLGHQKHLLDIQYRMHPSISLFPNSQFYINRILDAPHVTSKSYERHYLPEPMFGPYSFINVSGGREELDDIGHSKRNMVEVAIVLKLVQRLSKACNRSKEKIGIGIISPYAAQVAAIQDKLGKKHESNGDFSVKVKSVDGFQGGEEDVVIISTVRSNSGGAIGFLSNPQRINVALTRARHCLWILGNSRTLENSESVWQALVHDAKKRGCFFNADDDKELAKAILEVKKEYDQLDDLLNGNSLLFRSARWKVLFSDYFIKSFRKLASRRTKTSVLNLLLKLSSGWRPKKRNVDFMSESSSHILKHFKVEGLYLICSIDIMKDTRYTQVLKVWDVLRLEEIPGLTKRLNGIFDRYTDDFISHCNETCLEGDLEIPKNWSPSFDIIRYKGFNRIEPGSNLGCDDSDGGCYVENSNVSDSLLLMKFYSLSSGIVSHLLSDRDGKELELPFEVNDEEIEIILFQRSTFILGRSGTGKTTVLTMKLFKKEQLFHMATEGLPEAQDNNSGEVTCRSNVHQGTKDAEDCVNEDKKTVLRQLFVTVSTKLSFAIKNHVSQLTSFASGGKFSAETSSVDAEDIDGSSQFKGIPDSFVDIPPKSYPLVISFFKFLMMLDGTVGNSYFERFPDVRLLLHSETGTSSSISVQAFIKTKEVNYEKFSSVYWPHFNTKFTKKLDCSRVFTEIMSHIKGGLRAGESADGRLSRERYVILSEGRISTISRPQRETVYDIFEAYEKMKVENGEFDMADLVIDLHRRLKCQKYEGDMMDFVYIDEVQDLTMRQIALFKYISRNVNEGFVFSGDTAQTIARGIDFRFEDIRSLFYNEFVLGLTGDGKEGRKEKGQLSKIFHLSQNFRTHAGILKLAQSVIDLLYRFFPSLVDVLSPETSLIFGEAPILLASGSDENAIMTIFGNSGSGDSNFVGFGADQVILVRDDTARKEIYEYVGKQALVLTIVECKGLEFQDVLLYNFFGTSPLRNKWRVVYEYMKEQDLLDASFPKSYPSFNPSKHNILCSELKQLYVAITRTRQRLWICENTEDFSEPMFDYWKKKGFVQVKKLDDSLAQAMQVASTPDEWKSQGYKLLREGNFLMATRCFERAGDERGVKLAKAAGLKAEADRMHGSNPEMASVARRQAAEIFESIGKAEYAAECFYMLKEYERAGKLYAQCGESAMEKAGECFYFAENYKLAAEIYAKGYLFSKCLSACTKGKLFDMGLEYIQNWKQHPIGDKIVKRNTEMEKIEQEYLESCALHYHELNDKRAMMRYVRSFYSMVHIRTFLMNLGCLDELLSLEEESGNFLEAAKIAKLKGEVLREADLLGKAGRYKDGSVLILWSVFVNCLWSSGSRGWPLKRFKEKQELLAKAKSFAKEESDEYYELVCIEAEILSDERDSFISMATHLDASQKNKSLRGEIVSARKILDAHLHLNASKYGWNDNLVLDLGWFSEESWLKNQVYLESLVYSWNLWRDKIMNIFEYLGRLEAQDANEYVSYGEFCLNYLGVRRQFNNLNPIYLLMNADADWVRELDSRCLQRKEKLIFIDQHQFVSAAGSYWGSELLSVGMNVLTNLEALYNISMKNSFSLFCRGKTLTHIFDVANFLLNSKFLKCPFHERKKLEKFIGLSTEQVFGCIYPVDWRKSLKENMLSLRRTEIFRNFLAGVISEIVNSKKKLSYGQLGRISMIVLGSGKLSDELCSKIGDGLGWNPAWKAFFEGLFGSVAVKLHGTDIEMPCEPSLKWMLHRALEDIYVANWRNEVDYISPDCFLYHIERQLILLSHFQGYFLTTKTSFVEWLVYQEGNGSSTFSLVGYAPEPTERIVNFVAHVVQQFLIDKKDMMEWIRKSTTKVRDSYVVIVLRLMVVLCLLFLNFGLNRAMFGLDRDMFLDILGRKYITDELPQGFVNALRRAWKRNVNVNILAEALKKIGNPLVVVSLGANCSGFLSPDAIFVDLKVNQSKEDLLKTLVPKNEDAGRANSGAAVNATKSSMGKENSDGCVQSKSSKQPSSNASYTSFQSSNTQKTIEVGPSWGQCQLWKILESLKSINHEQDCIAAGSTLRVDIEKQIHLLSAAMDGHKQKNPPEDENKVLEEAGNLLEDLKELHAAIDVSEPRLDRAGELLQKLESRKPTMEPFLNQLVWQLDDKPKGQASPDESKMKVSVGNPASGNQSSSNVVESKGKGNGQAKKNKKSKGGRKRR